MFLVYFTILEPTTSHSIIDRIDPAINQLPAETKDLSIK
jgi:hypothetical protein